MIDQNTQKKLRQKFSPDGSSLRNSQMRMLEMLKHVDRICKENNITYWLSSGTCLGSVRHGGFIPWDDDVDIEMTLDDYKKFVKIINSSENHGDYIVQTALNDPYYFLPFGKFRDLNSEIHECHGNDHLYKFRGYYIDIFPIEPAGSKILHKLMSWILSYIGYFTQKKIIPIFISKTIFYKVIFRAISVVNRKVLSLKKNNRYRHVLGHGCPKLRMMNEIFPLKLMKFENYWFPIPSNPDAYLKRFYGDYNKLPSLEEIHIHTVEAINYIKGEKVEM